jgi:hypothetical protein
LQAGFNPVSAGTLVLKVDQVQALAQFEALIGFEMRAPFKYLALGFLVLAGFLFFLWPSAPKPVPPLPFDDKVFISTKPPVPLFAPSANAPVYARVMYFAFDKWAKLRGTSASTWSFPASGKTACSVQGLLNQCSSVSDTRYLMSIGVTVSIVQFGNTNTLNGPQWVAAFEKELQTGDVQYWDTQTKRTRPEHFAILRFPAQKTAVVLPEADAADFLRTNGIHLPESKAK